MSTSRRGGCEVISVPLDAPTASAERSACSAVVWGEPRVVAFAQPGAKFFDPFRVEGRSRITGSGRASRCADPSFAPPVFRPLRGSMALGQRPSATG